MPQINPILAFMSKYRDSSPYFAETLTVLRMHAKALRISDRQLPQGCAFPGKPMETGGISAGLTCEQMRVGAGLPWRRRRS